MHCGRSTRAQTCIICPGEIYAAMLFLLRNDDLSSPHWLGDSWRRGPQSDHIANTTVVYLSNTTAVLPDSKQLQNKFRNFSVNIAENRLPVFYDMFTIFFLSTSTKFLQPSMTHLGTLSCSFQSDHHCEISQKRL